MNLSVGARRLRPWLAALLAITLVAACGGKGRDDILGTGVVLPTPPTITAVAPPNGATGVSRNLAFLTAEFSEPVTFGGTASFTLSCTGPCISPTGTVSLDATGRIATLTLAGGTVLDALTLYTATINGATSVASGAAMAGPYTWTFTTGALADMTRPRVASTVPATTTPGPTPGVPANTAISVEFTEDMAPASINAGSFTVTCAAPCTAPAGTVTYVVGNRTAVFTPAAPLATGVVYTVTVTTSATDLAGNALAGNQAPLPAASDYIFSFSTVAAAPPAAVTVASSNPAAGASGVCPNASVNATFSVRLDPTSVNSANFTVAGPGPAFLPVAASSVVLDSTGRIATFTPAASLTPGLTYTATIRGGAGGIRDLATPANTMAADFVFSFTAGAPGGACLLPVPLNAIAPFGTFGGGAGMTNDGLMTIVNGDIGTTAVSALVTGFRDNTGVCTYTVTGSNNGLVNGGIFTAPPPAAGCPTGGNAATFLIATQAAADALAAYNDLAGRPGGPDPGAGSLANLVLAPGTYTAAAGSFMIQGGPLTLDAQGNPNAVWIFQMASTLLVGGPGAAFPQSVILVGGAQAKNVFWQVGSAATINAGGGGTMVGTIIAQTGVVISTTGSSLITTLNGRAIALNASVTMNNTIINVPAP